MNIRDEQPDDAQAIRSVNRAAFGNDAEADLVDSLRRHAAPLISLVAEDHGGIVGHILFSPAMLETKPEVQIMGLAPMAVVPKRQRQGIGSQLVAEGILRCQALNADAVVVLGHPAYYPRFGFVPASRFSIRSVYDVADDVFMIRELRAGALSGVDGIIRYHPVFAELDL
jgi:putative acetyltransferase